MAYNSLTYERIKPREHVYMIEGDVRRNYSFPTVARLVYGKTPSKTQRKNLSSLLRTVTSMTPRGRPNQPLFLSPFTRQPVRTKNLVNATTARRKNAVRVISNAYNRYKSTKKNKKKNIKRRSVRRLGN
jgi:hypothetical protein